MQHLISYNVLLLRYDHCHGSIVGRTMPSCGTFMTSQFKYIVNNTQKYKSVKCIFCSVWVENFIWNFKGGISDISHKILNSNTAKYFATCPMFDEWYLIRVTRWAPLMITTGIGEIWGLFCSKCELYIASAIRLFKPWHIEAETK